jgi:hypothetical protein
VASEKATAPAHRVNDAERRDGSLLGGNGQSDSAKILALQPIPAPAKESASDEARFLLREPVYSAIESARLFLDVLLQLVAADDVPGIRYACAKFAAFGRVVATGCEELVAKPLEDSP